MSIESEMPYSHFILCCPLLLLPSIFPSIRVFSSQSVLCIRWPEYWSLSFSISPFNQYSGLISFRMDNWKNDFYLMIFYRAIQLAWDKLWFLLSFILVQPPWDNLTMLELPRTEKVKSREPLEGQIMPFNSPTFCWKGLFVKPRVVGVTLCGEVKVGVYVVLTRVG